MQHENRWKLRAWAALFAALALGSAGCLPSTVDAPRAVLTADVLDSIDSALGRLAANRWPAWSLRVEGDQLAIEIDVADTSVADACRDLAAVLRESAGAALVWRADLTRAGAPLARCGTGGNAEPTLASWSFGFPLRS